MPFDRPPAIGIGRFDLAFCLIQEFPPDAFPARVEFQHPFIMALRLDHHAGRQLAMIEHDEAARFWIEESIAERRRQRRLDLRIDARADIFLIEIIEIPIVFVAGLVFLLAAIAARVGTELRLV